jgi:S-adenosylmethionine synthetase
MRKTSEWVSLGHPDKVADYISCYLLDRYLDRDPYTRFAVEVQIKDNFVTLGGEVTSKANYSPEDIAAFVRTAEGYAFLPDETIPDRALYRIRLDEDNILSIL